MNASIEIIDDDITTPLNVLNISLELIVGNIIRLDISNEPISLIPNTTIIEQIDANIMLYSLVLIPIDEANFSSKVIANILLYENIYKAITITDNIILI